MKRSALWIVPAGLVLLLAAVLAKNLRGDRPGDPTKLEDPGESVARKDQASRRDHKSARDSTEPADLLALVDITQDAVEGKWVKNGVGLVSPTGQWARLQLPCVPPDEYDLDLRVTRTGGTDSLNVGIVVNGRQCMAVFGGKDGRTNGLEMIDGKNFAQNESTASGEWLPLDQSVDLLLSIRTDGITASSRGQEILKWTGDPQKLSLFTGWRVPHGAALFIGSFESVFRVERATLTPISGRARLLR